MNQSNRVKSSRMPREDFPMKAESGSAGVSPARWLKFNSPPGRRRSQGCQNQAALWKRGHFIPPPPWPGGR